MEYNLEVNQSPDAADMGNEVTRKIREAQQNNQILGFTVDNASVQNEGRLEFLAVASVCKGFEVAPDKRSIEG